MTPAPLTSWQRLGLKRKLESLRLEKMLADRLFPRGPVAHSGNWIADGTHGAGVDVARRKAIRVLVGYEGPIIPIPILRAELARLRRSP